MKKDLNFLFSCLVTLLTLFPVFGFYFWHDDFSTIYIPQTGLCIYSWPYAQFCPILNTLHKVMGYHSIPYFSTGVILAMLTLVSFYFLLRHLFDAKTALVSSLIYSTFYVGSGVFQEAYDPIISFPSLALLFLSILLILRSKTVFGLIVFSMSVLWFSARSGTHFIPVIASLFLLTKKVSQIKKILLSFLVIVVFILSFLWPSYSIKNFSSSTAVDYPSKVRQFFLNTGSILVPDELVGQKNIDSLRITLAIVVYLSFCLSLKTNPKIKIFSLIWILSMYLPYGLRADFRLPATHRYLVFMFPGMVLAWATFSHRKFWLLISVLLIVSSLLLNLKFLAAHLNISRSRQFFYSQLHSLLPSISPGSVLFIDSKPEFANLLGDFFRVGYTPSESSIGTEYGIDYKSFKLITEKNVFTRLLKSKNVPIEAIQMFYYDGQQLTKTKLSDYVFEKKLIIKANIQPFSLPYVKNCEGCTYSTAELDSAHRQVEISRSLKRQVRVTASSTGEDTDIEHILDNDPATYWIARRQEWVVNPDVELNFIFPFAVNNLDISFETSSPGHAPVHTDISPKDSKSYKILITKTDGGDAPVINEIHFYSTPLAGLIENGSLIAKDESQKRVLDRFLLSGTKACVTWPGGQKNFYLIPDNTIHSYTIELPAVGPNQPNFSVGCLQDTPISLSIL